MCRAWCVLALTIGSCHEVAEHSLLQAWSKPAMLVDINGTKVNVTPFSCKGRGNDDCGYQLTMQGIETIRCKNYEEVRCGMFPKVTCTGKTQGGCENFYVSMWTLVDVRFGGF